MAAKNHTKQVRPRGHRLRAHITTFFIRKLFQFLGMIRFVDTTVIGRENLPKKGPMIIAPNHISMIDIIFVWTAMRRVAIALGAAELFGNPYIGWLGKLLGFVPVARKNTQEFTPEEAARSGAKARMLLADVLAWAGTVIMFGEGRCVSPGDYQPFRPGIADLSFQSGAPIVPVYIDGANRVLPLKRDLNGRKRFNLREKVTMIIGTPIDPKHFDSAESLLVEVEARVFALAAQLPRAA